MERADIAALAEGMVPFVRESVTEATAPLAARIAELEARPIEKGDAGPQGPPGPKGDTGEVPALPPALAEQVANAVRLLHESPAMEPRSKGEEPAS
jgi:hypothetical protein